MNIPHPNPDCCRFTLDDGRKGRYVSHEPAIAIRVEEHYDADGEPTDDVTRCILCQLDAIRDWASE